MTQAVDPHRRFVVARTIAVRGLSILSTFLLAALVSQSLGPQGAGAFFLVYAIVALCATLARLGTDNLALRILGGDSQSPRRDVAQMGRLVALWSVAAFGVCVTVVGLIVGDTISLGMALIVASSVLPQALSVLAGAVLRGLGYLSTGVWAELGSIPTISCLALGAIALGAPSAVSLDLALLVFAGASWCTAIWSVPLAWALSRRRLPLETSDARTFTAFVRTRLPQLLPMMATSLLYFGLVWAPVFVLSITSSLVEVSFYSVALRVANLVLLLPAIQVSYLAPQFAKLYYAGEVGQLNSLANRSVRHVAAVTAVPLLVLCIAAPQIVALVFGQEFVQAAPIVVVLSVGSFIAVLAGQVNQLMLLCGLERFAFATTSGVVVLWVSIGVWVGAASGAMGVAWLAAVLGIVYAFIAAVRLRASKHIRSYLRFTIT